MQKHTRLLKIGFLVLGLLGAPWLAWGNDSVSVNTLPAQAGLVSSHEKTRTEVNAELVQAQRCGNVWNGDSDYPSSKRELHPKQYPSTADCRSSAAGRGH